MPDKTDFNESGTVDIARVEFGVSGGELLDPKMISQQTRIEPSRAWAKGEEYFAKRSHQLLKKYQGLWVVSRESNVVQLAAEELLHVVEPQFELLCSLAKAMQGQMSVGIWWEPKEGQGGFTLTSDIVRRLSNLGERIDIYFPG